MNKQQDIWIRANGAGNTGSEKLVPLTASFTIEAEGAAAGDGKKPGPRKFTMTAYTGGAMQVGAFYRPVVIDLSGLSGTDKARPIFRDHDPGQVVGHTTQLAVKGNALLAEGLISGAGEAAREVLAAHDNGFPWQASVGARVLNVEFIDEGSSAVANGQTFNGPINIVRKAVLGEISFVPLGADDNTSARIAANAAEGVPMDFSAWLKAKGFELDKLSDQQKSFLKAQFDAEQEAAADAAKNKTDGSGKDGKDGKTVTATGAEPAVDPIAELRDKAAAEMERQSGIAAARAKYPSDKADEIQAKAVKDGWSVDKASLELLQAHYPKAPGAIIRQDESASGSVLEAACVLAGGMSTVPVRAGDTVKRIDVDKVYDGKTLDAAAKRFRHGIGLQELFLEAAWANGYAGRSFKQDPMGVLRAAMAVPMVQASGLSTLSLPGILSNVANKFLLDGFTAVEDTWRRIASIRPVNDFKTVTSYRLTGDMEFEEVGPGGELNHGEFSEDSFTNRAKTYGKIHGITRKDLINDDLGALTKVPQMLGRGSALKFNKVFWTEFLNNAAFFTAARKNYFDGAATVLSIDSLTTAETMFLNQTDDNGDPLGVAPDTLLVPNALSTKATSLTRDTEIRDTTASTKYTTSNPHAGKWQPVRSSYLSNATLAGYSAVAWYLLSSLLPVIEAAFLNGQQNPTVETAEADFNVLGVLMRGYFDFGVSKQDYRGGVKSKGAA